MSDGVAASVVSRYLSARGFHRSEWHPSASVRGWGNQSSGFKCEQSYADSSSPAVRVSWIPGDGYRTRARKDVREQITLQIAALSAELEKKYVVHMEKPDQVFGGDPYLMVTEKKSE